MTSFIFIKTMRTLFSSLLAAVLVMCFAVSCNKNNDLPSGSDESEPCELAVTFGGVFDAEITTRVASSDAAKDNTIESVQIFVFNINTGRLDASLHKKGINLQENWTGTETVKCTTGPRTVYALVNCPADYVEGPLAISSITELEALTTSLGDNSPSSMVMVGKVENQTLTTAANSVTLDVNRCCAKVVLESIRNDMYAPVYRDKVVITGAYLMNVPGKCSLFGTTASRTNLPDSDWYAKNAKETSSTVLGLVAETFPSGGVSLSYSSSPTTFGNALYSYSNDLTSAAGDTWKKSSTYLIVEATIAGENYVYPVQLPALQANYCYKVALTLHRVGGDPDEPFKEVQFADATPTIKVVKWQETDQINKEI